MTRLLNQVQKRLQAGRGPAAPPPYITPDDCSPTMSSQDPAAIPSTPYAPCRPLTVDERLRFSILCQHTEASYNMTAQLLTGGLLRVSDDYEFMPAGMNKSWVCQMVQYMQIWPDNHEIWSFGAALRPDEGRVQATVWDAFQLVCELERNRWLTWVAPLPRLDCRRWDPTMGRFVGVLRHHAFASDSMIANIMSRKFKHTVSIDRVRYETDIFRREGARRRIYSRGDSPTVRAIIKEALDIVCRAEAAGDSLTWDAPNEWDVAALSWAVPADTRDNWNDVNKGEDEDSSTH
ncbi:MAG: hypothetical protein M1832_001813 [Thelocarpon impressellum]|nr:MAG: hypothetical protein M1832_001813 [Thelocarpon impressellum]